MICNKCSHEKKEYIGFNARAGDQDNPWDCTNPECGTENTKAPEMGVPGERWKNRYRAHIFTQYTSGYLNDKQYREAMDHMDTSPFPFNTLWGYGYTIDFTPIRSEPVLPAPAPQASSGIALRLRRWASAAAGVTDLAGTQQQCGRTGALDDPDHSTLQQQGGHQPRTSSTPKLLHRSSYDAKTGEMLDSWTDPVWSREYPGQWKE